jgi:hypothetical protein
MVVLNYIYTTYNERGMKAFQNRVKKTLNGLKAKEIICHNAYMSRGNGYGSYYKVIELQIDGNLLSFSTHTNDSQMWDNFETTSKNKRQLFEAVLNENLTEILEFN